MTVHPASLLLAASLIAIAGCATKPPKALPPAPVGSTGAVQPVTPFSTSPAAGSQEDFVAGVVADRIFFDTDKSDLNAQAQATLRSQAAWLAKYLTKRVTVEGHCDERGTREYNVALGERRANSTKNALVALGVNPSRITTISYGKERPDATGSDEEAYARNRRAVTVTIQ